MKKCKDCGKEISKVSKRCRKCAKLNFSYEFDNRNKKITKLYSKEKISTKDISNLMGLSQIRIQQILRQNNIKLTHHIYPFDESIIINDCPEKFYLLGLFASDGTISKNRSSKFVEITLNEKDRILLDDIRKLFKTEKPLFLGKDGCLKFTLFSDIVYDMLVSYGIRNRKSLSLELKKEIPKEYTIDFLRGYFDGDGSITGKLKQEDVTLGITASEKFVNQLIKMYSDLGFEVKLYSYKKKRKNEIFLIKKTGKDALKILAYFYARKSLFMPRKYNKFLEFVRLTPDECMMESAHTFAKRSTCIRRKVGCVISNSDKTNIVSIGYNGNASGEPNYCESVLPGECNCVHAEVNSLIKGSGKILYCTTIPCKQCAKLIVNSGIKEVYYDSDYRYSYAIGLFRRSKIKCKQLKKESFDWKNEIASILEWKDKEQ